jgi:hypothetical protein
MLDHGDADRRGLVGEYLLAVVAVADGAPVERLLDTSFGDTTTSPDCRVASRAAPSGRSASGIDPLTPRSTNTRSSFIPCIVT